MPMMLAFTRVDDLSEASFQETARVLAKAALRGSLSNYYTLGVGSHGDILIRSHNDTNQDYRKS
jgi:hypothetical protein